MLLKIINDQRIDSIYPYYITSITRVINEIPAALRSSNDHSTKTWEERESLNPSIVGFIAVRWRAVRVPKHSVPMCS